MSVPSEELPDDIIDHDMGNSDEEDNNAGNKRRRRKKKKRRSYRGFAGKFRRAKQVLLSSFPGDWDCRRPIQTTNEGVASDPRCVFCIGRPQTLESPVESDTSDPNSPAFTHEMLRVLVEKNDFYCKECDPHLDVDELLHCYNQAQSPGQDK